jgi:BirA family transcriptional regulator, biotin operon repressor / biotin---[acetyl-CoA-carboxylase] ligase
MTQAAETWTFDTARIGRRVLVFEELASTNTTAAELAAFPHSDGLVVVANHQTTGRGQHGRVWQSRPGSSLLMSVVLHPPSKLRRPVILTALAAVAVAEAILQIVGEQARIKWPNDLQIRDKKVCGILIEQHVATTIMGIGLNLNQSSDDFAAVALPDATSLTIASGLTFETRTVAGVVLQQLDQHYHQLLNEDRGTLVANWNWRLGLLGQEVAIELMDGSMTAGRLLEMDFDRLEFDGGDGTIKTIVPELVRHITRS